MATPLTQEQFEQSIWQMFVEACEANKVEPEALAAKLAEIIEE